MNVNKLYFVNKQVKLFKNHQFCTKIKRWQHLCYIVHSYEPSGVKHKSARICSMTEKWLSCFTSIITKILQHNLKLLLLHNYAGCYTLEHLHQTLYQKRLQNCSAQKIILSEIDLWSNSYYILTPFETFTCSTLSPISKKDAYLQIFVVCKKTIYRKKTFIHFKQIFIKTKISKKRKIILDNKR